MRKSSGDSCLRAEGPRLPEAALHQARRLRGKMEAWRLLLLLRKVPPTVGGGRVLPADSSPPPPLPTSGAGSRGEGSCRRPAGPGPGCCAPAAARVRSDWFSSTLFSCSDTRSSLGCPSDSVLLQVPACPELRDIFAFQNFFLGFGADSQRMQCEPFSVSSEELFPENSSWESSHHHLLRHPICHCLYSFPHPSWRCREGRAPGEERSARRGAGPGAGGDPRPRRGCL